MTSFFDDLEAQLRAAAERRTQSRERPQPERPPRGTWGWLRAGARAVPVLGAVTTTVVVAVAALLLLGHRHGHKPASSPPTGSLQSILNSTPRPRLRREFSYLNAASRKMQSVRGCEPHPPLRGSFIHGSPGSALLSILGVLRRPAVRTDRLDPQPLEGVAHVYVGYVRRALVYDGVSYYIAADRNDFSALLPAARCRALEVAALNRELPRIPASLRKPTQVLQTTLLAQDRRLVAGEPRQTICLATVSKNSGGAECGLGAAAIKHGIAPSDDQGIFSGVVPDGVATVTLHLREKDGQATTGTAPVTGNMYAIRVPKAINGVNGVAPVLSFVWRSADGGVLKDVYAPDAHALASYCRRHAVTCAAMTAGISVQSSSSSSNGAAYSGTASATSP